MAAQWFVERISLFSCGTVDINIRILQVALVAIKDKLRSEHALSGP
ncbi:hypothetical protein M3895_003754 [Vibrio parahaemolyticus]|nr:hypothetical protein [Vibrio parahaemolyticus]EJE4168369.1 hypothetical protein [Vibrio parahaemolyticus]MCI9705978.1 hypothetical protein [Vibrio parahaemolyticus]MDF5484222.1 hypothetical protein [Vibrio parahaemolyticus]MDG2839806.1 hypothetical protein [Vibrio parahaemolyticus]HBC3357496.1 hypothetical protein [Vibrio parahaemolyticus]